MVVVAHPPQGELDLAAAAGLPSDEVLSCLGTGPGGLSAAAAAERLRQVGPNALGTHRVRAFAVLFRQIRNPILILLLGAAVVSGLTGGGTNALIIAVIVALSVGWASSTNTGRKWPWPPCAPRSGRRPRSGGTAGRAGSR